MKTKTGLLYILVMLSLVCVPSILSAGTNGPSPIPNPPNFFISSYATALCRGQVNFVPITITNAGTSFALGSPNVEGSQMQNIQLSLSDSKSVYSLSNSTVNAGNINPNTTVTVYMPIFIAANASSITTVQIGINYYFYALYSDSEVRNLTFGVQTCKTPLLLNVTPRILTSGGIEDIKVNLTNTGPKELNNISVSLQTTNNNAAELTTQPTEVNSILPGRTVTINDSLYVYSNASQSFAGNFTINFYNGTSLRQLYQKFAFLSTGTILINYSSLSLSPSNPAPGSIFSISFILTNTGTTGATDTYVIASPPSGIKPFGSPSTFVGSLGEGTQTPVTISLQVSNNTKPGNYQVPIKVEYQNSLRNNLTTTFNVTVPVSNSAPVLLKTEASTHKGSGTVLVGIVIIVIVGIAGYLMLRKRRTK